MYATHSKSNSTSFMFNNIFCEMNIKIVIHWGEAWGNGGTFLISSLKLNFKYILISKQYSH